LGILEHTLAIRYFRRRLITAIATVAVGVSVFIVIVVMTIMNGLVVDFKQRNHAFFGDCVIASASMAGFSGFELLSSRLTADDAIDSVTPQVRSFAILTRAGWTTNAGVSLVGIDTETIGNVTCFRDTLYLPAGNDVFETKDGAPGCVRGIAMMNSRGPDGEYHHGIDKNAQFTLTSFPLSRTGMPAKQGSDISSSKTFSLPNDSNSRLAKEDNYNIYVPLEQAQLLCGMSGAEPRVTHLLVKFADGVKLEEGCEKVRRIFDQFRNEASADDKTLLDNVSVMSWKMYRREIIAPVEKEQLMLTLMFLLIGLVTVFVVLVVFVLLVNSKNKDIGIMKSFGVSGGKIADLFLQFASLTALTGAGAGAICAVLFLSRINALEQWLYSKFGWQLWDRSMYVIDEIPDKIRPEIIVTVIVCAVASAMIGALGPALKAARQKPADTLRVGNC
jgi:ABC-type lipoprotein release transport system permease subunit